MPFTEAELIKYGLKESTPPATPPKEKREYKQTEILKIIEAKRADLEMLKIDKEIERLNKPDTNIDYYGKMLEIQAKQGEIVLQQQKHFAEQQLTSQKQMFEVQLELERMKLGNEGGDYMNSFIDILKPLLPVLLAGGGKGSPGAQSAPTMANSEKLKGGKPRSMNKEAKKEYLRQIQAGKITLQLAYEDFKKEAPKHAEVVTIERFADFYNKLKNNDKEAVKTYLTFK